MKKNLLIIILLNIHYLLFSQSLPEKQMLAHLNKSKEGANRVSILKIFESDSQALYCFSSGAVHYYNFLLLKNGNTYQILNGDNFIEEYSIIKKWFNIPANDSIAYYTIPIIGLFQHNYQYHPTPPFPNLKPKKCEESKLIYPPRTLILTAPFQYKQ